MKKLILLAFIICGCAFASINAQGNKSATSNDSAAKKAHADSIQKAHADSVKKALIKDSARIVDSINALDKANLVESPCDTCNLKVCKPGKLANGGAWILVFSPIVLFIVLLILLSGNLKGFKLSEAISETELVKITKENPQYTAAALNNIATSSASANVATILPPTIDVTDTTTTAGIATPPRPSSSRFIALITSMLTIVIALCLSCFFIYFYIATGAAPDISKFSSVLLALGVGVVPYAFNKVASAITNKPSTPEQ